VIDGLAPRAAAVVVGLVLLSGCGGGGSPGAAKRETSHLRTLVSLYNYQANSTGRPPANEQEFKKFIEAKGAAALETLNISDPGELFVSERDGKPFVILYGKRPPGVDVVGYEQDGVDGKREVGLGLGNIVEVDEAKLRELVPPAAQPK
jgi:hypothetical protein